MDGLGMKGLHVLVRSQGGELWQEYGAILLVIVEAPTICQVEKKDCPCRIASEW